MYSNTLPIVLPMNTQGCHRLTPARWTGINHSSLTAPKVARLFPSFTEVNSSKEFSTTVLRTEYWSSSLSDKIPVPNLPWWLSAKESACWCKRLKFDPWVGKISRRKWLQAGTVPSSSVTQRESKNENVRLMLWGEQIGAMGQDGAPRPSQLPDFSVFWVAPFPFIHELAWVQFLSLATKHVLTDSLGPQITHKSYNYLLNKRGVCA